MRGWFNRRQLLGGLFGLLGGLFCRRAAAAEGPATPPSAAPAAKQFTDTAGWESPPELCTTYVYDVVGPVTQDGSGWCQTDGVTTYVYDAVRGKLS
jgi:hypothetical protein